MPTIDSSKLFALGVAILFLWMLTMLILAKPDFLIKIRDCLLCRRKSKRRDTTATDVIQLDDINFSAENNNENDDVYPMDVRKLAAYRQSIAIMSEIFKSDENPGDSNFRRNMEVGVLSYKALGKIGILELESKHCAR
uniref:Uncharacterized protein n=1 Tax=Romanomermis culicivorax TaxID=13658 RepID=A0A915LC46_ROMCU